MLPAFLIEAAFYLMPGFEAMRKALDGLRSRTLRAALLAASAVIPYLSEAPRTGTFRMPAFLMLAGAAMAASFWYVWIRPSLPWDLLFLAFLGAVYLKLFEHVYGQPAPHVPLAILGKLMWIRLGIFSIFSLRGIEDPGFGFVPSRSEWRIGFLYYLYFLPLGGALAYALRFAGFHAPGLEWWKLALVMLATFLAILWVVALAEEFFFRAFLQRLLGRALGSETAALMAASAVFGAAHLPFRHFPNWPFAIVAGASGIFYGQAFLKARSVRASMITHALVVTTWRVFFAQP